MVKKDRSEIVKTTYQFKMLPELYQKHLKNLLSESQLLFFYLVVIIVQDIKNVKLEKIAESCLGAVAHGVSPMSDCIKTTF
ncbi:MAG: hypothetical protein F6K59_17250 [Moorea sp. SIO3F7]|nr:hypothetical protein [Moorena sp. SIO3E8]NEQ00602.1 hypothetical protein [Moorena sp. SIO3F7]